MKIFFSHPSQVKPAVKTVIKYMPASVQTWLDENDLAWGDRLTPVFEEAIKTQSDYVVIFINELAARSEWVRKELGWAMEREKELGRTFVLPVYLRSEGDNVMSLFPELASRKNIQITDYTEFGLKTAADQLTAGLFALICEDINKLQNPPAPKAVDTIGSAEEIIRNLASRMQEIIFPHRQESPMTVDDMAEQVCMESNGEITPDEFTELLEKIVQRNMIPGLYYDGYEMYLVEEHSLWKARMNHQKKAQIARKAASYIRSNMKVYIDAGSTSAEVVKILCKRMEMRALTGLTIVTPSINHADLISECSVKMGFDDEFSAVKLYIPKGLVRPGTQAIVPMEGEDDSFDILAKQLGGYDIAVIGANGIDRQGGLTTHANLELAGKVTAFRNARKPIIICDDSKYGIVLESKIVSFEENFLFISNKNPDLEVIRQEFPDRVILV